MAAEDVLFSEPRLWVSKLVSKLETGNWIHEKTSVKLLQQVSLRASITLNKNRYSASEPALSVPLCLCCFAPDKAKQLCNSFYAKQTQFARGVN